MDIFKICAPEGINGLRIIAHTIQFGGVAKPVKYEPLNGVGVLHFIDQNMIEPAGDHSPDILHGIAVKSACKEIKNVVVV